MPTPNYSLNRLRRMYLAAQSAPLTLPGSITGTSNYCLFTKLDITGDMGMIRRPDITGSRSDLPAVPGRHTGSFNVSMSMAGNSTSGTVPDVDPLLQATFGQTATLVAAIGPNSDLASSNGTNATPSVTSVSHSFVTGDIGKVINITSGTNWIAGSYMITAVSGGAATLNNACGTSATLSTGTYTLGGTVTYALSDNIITAAIYHYRHTQSGGTTLTNQISMGSTVQQATFTLGPDIATCEFSGKSIFVLDSDNFSSLTGQFAAAAGGLSSFPSEPSTPTFHGTPVVGFTGSISTDNNTVVELKSATVKVSTGNMIVDDTFGQYFGSGVQGDFRQIDVSLVLDDSDSTAMIDLKQKAFAATPITIVVTCGTLIGNTWTFNLSNTQMVNPKFSEGGKGRMRLDFQSCVAHGALLAGTDALSLVIA